jgi:coenzyme F420 biosynthesis associated uncharacterized protein
VTQTQPAPAPPEPESSAPDPVDWALAARVARRFAGREPAGSAFLAGALRSDFTSVTVQAEDLVAEHTGLRAPGTATADVLDRSRWIDANVSSMRRLLSPLTVRIGERVAKSPIAPVGRRVAGTEVGVLLGFMAQRVLGQYDVLVPDDPQAPGGGGAVYYVGANIVALEKRYAFRSRDFRLWIAIHEVTHRAQFTAVPWLKPYFMSLVDQALAIVDADPGRLMHALRRAADDLRRGHNPLDDGGLVALLATDEQRGVLDRVQALMSLLEGHGNSVMNHVGSKHVAGQERMARVLQARRRSRGFAGFLYKLLGIESKMRQYELGEAFVEAVEREGGSDAITAVWRAPDALPTLDELREPTRWLARVS